MDLSAPVLEMAGVSKSYGTVRALHDLSLTIGPGEILAVLGPNGAGKTTAIKCCTGILRPHTGTVRICGYDILRRPVDARRRFGFVPDDPFLYPQLTGREHLEFFAGVYGLDGQRARERVAALADAFRMDAALDQRVSTYSHGMKHKLAWMAALLHRPRLLFVDEPTVGLDPAAARLVRDLLDWHRREGHSVFLTTHILAIAEALADRIAIIDRGALVACGTLGELREQAARPGSSLEDVFLALTRTDVEASLIRAFQGEAEAGGAAGAGGGGAGGGGAGGRLR